MIFNIHSEHPCDYENGGCSHTCEEVVVVVVVVVVIVVVVLSEHPCDYDNGGCSHTCGEVGAKAVCKCPVDMQLKTDNKTCETSK